MKPIWLLPIRCQRPASRVALECLQIEGLGHDALAREGRVAVDQNWQRSRWVVGTRGVVGLVGASLALDHRVDGFEVARIRRKDHVDRATGGLPRRVGAKVVLDVTGALLGVQIDRADRALAFELAQKRAVRTAEGVFEHVHATAVGHPDDGLVRAGLARRLERPVEHRHEHVEPLDRELLLRQECAPQVSLETFDLREPEQQLAALVSGKRCPMLAQFRGAAQPDTLLVARDVLDLVGHGLAVGGAKMRERLGKRLARNRDSQYVGRDARLQLGRERRRQAFGLERGVAERLRAKWIEPSREVTVHSVSLDERHRSGDRGKQVVVRHRSGRIGVRGRCRREGRG